MEWKQELTFLTETQQILCLLLGSILFDHKKELDSTLKNGRVINWTEVWKESRLQTVELPAFSECQDLTIASDLLNKIIGSVQQSVFYDVTNLSWHDELDKLMTDNGIPYCILKGAASQEYYPKGQFRMMGDVDFLVSPEDVERAAKVLKEAGFQAWNEKHICHIVFGKGREHYELHFEPAGVPGGKAGSYARELLNDIQETAVRVKSDEFSYVIPDDFHHGLIMLLHMQHHLLAEGIGLRHLCDWAVFVNTLSGKNEDKKEFEDLFRKKLTKIGLWKFAQNISLAAVIALGLPYQEWMGCDTKLARALVKDIFAGGNFGAKDSERATEGIFISNRGKDGVRHNRMTQAVLSVNQVAYTHWPITKKVKVLLPFAWCYCVARRVVLIATGKRKKMHLTAAYKKSASRREIYEKMKLFEVD